MAGSSHEGAMPCVDARSEDVVKSESFSRVKGCAG